MKALSCLFLRFAFRKCAPLMFLLGMASLGICQNTAAYTCMPRGLARTIPVWPSYLDSTKTPFRVPSLRSLPAPFPRITPHPWRSTDRVNFYLSPAHEHRHVCDRSGQWRADGSAAFSHFLYSIPGSEQAPSNPLSSLLSPLENLCMFGFQNGDFPGNPNGNSSITPFCD